jgi:hypothetical protein
VKEPIVPVCVEDEAVRRVTVCVSTMRLRKHVDHVGDEINVSTLAVLRSADRSAGVAPPHADDCLLQIVPARS